MMTMCVKKINKDWLYAQICLLLLVLNIEKAKYKTE